MVQILLTTNDERNLIGKFIVSEVKLIDIRELQHFGGFKRFDIDVIEDDLKGKSEYSKAVDWIDEKVFLKK